MEHTAGDALGQGGGHSKEAFGELVSELQCYKIGATLDSNLQAADATR